MAQIQKAIRTTKAASLEPARPWKVKLAKAKQVNQAGAMAAKLDPSKEPMIPVLASPVKAIHLVEAKVAVKAEPMTIHLKKANQVGAEEANRPPMPTMGISLGLARAQVLAILTETGNHLLMAIEIMETKTVANQAKAMARIPVKLTTA
jgi:hypothetical protein